MLGLMGDRLRKWLRGAPHLAEGDAAAETTALREPSGTGDSNDDATDGHDHKGSANEPESEQLTGEA
jgi:hypothetical protein